MQGAETVLGDKQRSIDVHHWCSTLWIDNVDSIAMEEGKTNPPPRPDLTTEIDSTSPPKRLLQRPLAYHLTRSQSVKD